MLEVKKFWSPSCGPCRMLGPIMEKVLSDYPGITLVDEISLDGCSIHLTETDRKEYIKEIYSSRGDDIPESYDRPIGNFGYNAYITDGINKRLLENKSIRLTQVELKNLMNMEEVVIEYL